MTISDEAVEAGRKAIERNRWTRSIQTVRDGVAVSSVDASRDDARAALEAAAPHLYPASGEVGRALTPDERDMMGRAVQRSAKPLYDLSASGEVGGDNKDAEIVLGLADVLIKYSPTPEDRERAMLIRDAGVRLSQRAARAHHDAALAQEWRQRWNEADERASVAQVRCNELSAALSEATERAGRMERERDEARQGERNLSEHARKVAGEANEAFGVVEHMEEFWDACGYPSNRGHLTPAEQVSALVRERDDAEARAQSAEAKVKELEAPFDWTAEDLVDLMAEAIMDAIDMDTNATDYARAALIALNKEGLLRPNDYREPQQ